MASISGRTSMSSRGQIVIPKALREAAGLAEGDDVLVLFDGERLVLTPLPEAAEGQAEAVQDRVRECGASYAATRDRGEPSERASKVWADRIRAAARIKQARQESQPGSVEELLSAARRGLRGEGDDRG